MTLPQSDNFHAEKPLAVNKQQSNNSPELSKSEDIFLGSVEFSEPLENDIALEEQIVRYVTVSRPSSASVPAGDARSPLMPSSVSQTTAPEEPEALGNAPHENEIVIPLWDERLKINRRKRKVGEVVVRKEIETRIIEVPIRREKLIVEQVSPDYQQIAVVELGQAEITEFDNVETFEVKSLPIVTGEFSSAHAAIQFLNAIATKPDSEPQKVQIRVVLKDETLQATYQNLINQYSSNVAA